MAVTVKMQRAEELRDSHLEGKRRKAQEEEDKIEEIAFINRRVIRFWVLLTSALSFDAS
jgi:hypothetical protein